MKSTEEKKIESVKSINKLGQLTGRAWLTAVKV